MEARPYSWQAHGSACHPIEKRFEPNNYYNNRFNVCDDSDNNSTAMQNAVQRADTEQLSSETIIVKDSCDIEISSTETQVAVALQVVLQVAIALVINLTIADSIRAEAVTQELLQKATITQANKQKLIIENSKNVVVTTTDTDVAISLQVLIQILVALVVQIDIL
ncbi:spore coat protein [Anoxybacillus rupiensis]|jgi:spore coat protein X|uniref:Spore coat protein n=1 Tax=Anoxybacteroides rupiense TaxID=311460 RepID=A0ABD5IVU8_9BACL|nr:MULTISPECIES: spore coat protein [Anoxybacillus]MBB3908961.1 spore coat protein X [Anoxybacillus rupiensis]MBS2772251.1 spore coat protein [Anoxybacillus rupiensis]MDE8564960.1 spore coat protein [Anoxybacillus rupiensis]MED5052447.1 spore coat protein [Anoxybacillus rupiensis]OQM44345.1 hypothetical protein B6A27_17215 [Anoxybacillus sp. UARK-01]